MSILIENLSTLQNVIYIISSMLFITGIKMLGKEDTAVRGNFLSALAMFIAVSITLVNVVNPLIIIIGISVGAILGSVIALKVKMTSIPEMVALFNGFGGLATFFIAWSEYSTTPENYFQYILIMLTTFIGGVTFTGSIVAYGKLSERLTIKKTSLITKLFTTIFYVSLFYLIYSAFFTDIFEPNFDFYLILIILTLLGGIGFVLPIGGGDMPVVISLLNSFSGIAAAFAGLMLLNNVLIVAGSLVGASGLILTIIMAKAMKKEGLTPEKFMEINKNQRQLNPNIDNSSEDLDKFRKVVVKLEEIMNNAEKKRQSTVKMQGLALERFLKIEEIVAKSKNLQEKVQKMLGN